MFILNGNPLAVDTAFTHNDIQYPANWLRLASPEERLALGITEAPDPVRYDDRFYWAPGIPKDLLGLKKQWTDQLNMTVWSMLNPTDFMDSRKANDPTYEAPADWLAWRASVRSVAKTAKAAIEVADTVEYLIPVINPEWPLDPSSPNRI